MSSGLCKQHGVEQDLSRLYRRFAHIIQPLGPHPGPRLGVYQANRQKSRREMRTMTVARHAAWISVVGLLGLTACSPGRDSYPVAERAMTDLSADFAAGKVSSEALTRAYIARIKAEDTETRAVLAINPGAARRPPRRPKTRGRQDGRPDVTCKDNIDFAGMPTTAGSPRPQGERSRQGFANGAPAGGGRRGDLGKPICRSGPISVRTGPPVVGAASAVCTPQARSTLPDRSGSSSGPEMATRLRRGDGRHRANAR